MNKLIHVSPTNYERINLIRFGKMTYASGEVYEGEWKRGKRHGKGKTTEADGDKKTFENTWRNGKETGERKEVLPEKKAVRGRNRLAKKVAAKSRAVPRGRKGGKATSAGQTASGSTGGGGRGKRSYKSDDSSSSSSSNGGKSSSGGAEPPMRHAINFASSSRNGSVSLGSPTSAEVSSFSSSSPSSFDDSPGKRGVESSPPSGASTASTAFFTPIAGDDEGELPEPSAAKEKKNRAPAPEQYGGVADDDSGTIF